MLVIVVLGLLSWFFCWLEKKMEVKKMKFVDLSAVRFSYQWDIQHCIVWEQETDKDLVNGCSVEYAIEHFANMEIKRISVADGMLIFTV